LAREHLDRIRLLYGEFVFSDGKAVDELKRGPEPVKLGTLVYVDDPVGRRLSVPHDVVQEALDPIQNHLKYRESAAESFSRQKVA